MAFPDKLVSLRIQAGFTTRIDFAKALGVPVTTLRNYETGEREPGHTFLIRAAKLLDVSVDYLLDLTDNRTQPEKMEGGIMSQYYSLDSYGKALVNLVLEHEFKRCVEQAQKIRELQSMLNDHLSQDN